MNLQNYTSKKLNRYISVSAFYSKEFKWKVILPTVVVNYLKDKITTQKPFLGFKLEIALYYLSLIISIPSFKKDKKYFFGYIPLNSVELRKKNNEYKKYFDYFHSIELLEYKEYVSGITSRRYRYNYSKIKVEGNECINFETFEISDKKLKEKLIDDDNMRYGHRTCPHLSKWLNEDLKIDFNTLKIDFENEFCYNKYLNYDKVNAIMSKAYNYWYSALMIEDKCFRITRDKKADNRLHTNLTNMPSKFRHYISFRNEKISSFDIKNSQPYFMILLIENINNVEIIKLIKEIFSNCSTILQKLAETTSSKAFNDEYIPLKNAVLSGTFYEFLGNVFPEIVADEDGKFRTSFYNKDLKYKETLEFETKRDLMKKLTLQILYSPLIRPSKEYQIFKDTFPHLCQLIEVFKSTTNDKDSYKLFPKLLQHLEADFVLDKVTKGIADKYPDMPLWTIHDSFCTTLVWFNILKHEVIERFFRLSRGVIPAFKDENWAN